MTPPLDPREAWNPLPPSAWNIELASHLLRRAGWAARPEEVARAVREGLQHTLNRLFPVTPPPLPKPILIDKASERIDELRAARRKITDDPDARRLLEREERELERAGALDFNLKWLQAAADPSRSAYEKWLLFLADIYVVSMEKVNRADWMFAHHDILRQHGAGTAPALAKAVSRSPAMIRYLDLDRSSKGSPNENFARELFELFTLGEGNYTEDDIKNAARAFTGYRYGPQGFRLAERDRDTDMKTVFGQLGRFTGDDVIDIAYAQPAASRFLPTEMARFYLSDRPLPEGFIQPLADWWRESGHNLRDLCRRFFGSVAFYHPSFRANFIKSPVQFHLGLVQDLGLDVAPVQRISLLPVRQMGQNILQPPNVRGWVGGQLWINSSTLAARRALAQTLCSPLDENQLNADDRLELLAARDAGLSRFTVDEERIRAFTALGPDGIADRLCDYFLPVRVSAAYRAALVDYLAAGPDDEFETRARQAAIAVLQSPEYQLC
jgi:uncharacterized protein (DUF1800 family)